jgi:hypothetical protein
MTPEMKQAIMDLLSKADTSDTTSQSLGSSGVGGSYQVTQNTSDHADAQQDYDQICQVIETKLAPAFEMIGQELKSLRDENDGLKDIVYKLITSFSGAVDSHRRTGLQESVMGQYGPDLEALGPVYKDFTDGDITSDLMDALMQGDGDPLELAGQHITALKGKFGKYLGGATPASTDISIEAKPSGEEAPPIEGEDPEKPDIVAEGETPDVAKKDAGPPGKSDPVLNMMKMLEAQRGPRKTA